MKKPLPAYLFSTGKALVLAAGIVCFPLVSDATIIRVDNNPGSPGTYITAQDAHNAASSGDTLYFTGSGTSYGNLTVTKTLYLFGPGYFLTQNPETQANVNPATLGTIIFNAGSQGSLMTGLSASRLDLNTNNLVIKRNYISANQVHGINIATGLGNIMILQNYVLQGYHGNSAINVANGCSNIQIRNNLFTNYYSSSTSYPAATIASSVEFANNVLFGSLSISSSQVFNNIWRFGNLSGSGNYYQHNIANAGQFGTANGNQHVADMSTIFMGGSSSDGQWRLKPGSPAIDAGVGGDDIGMFGGADAYVLSGLPAVPAIWFFNGPATGSGPAGLPVQVKVKSHN